MLTAPINIPDKIPDVDLSKAVTDEKDFSGKGVAGGKANGVVGGVPQNSDQPYFEFQVEKPALPREGNPNPKYPSMLESSRVEGEVLAQFVVDTSGKADMSTFKVLSSIERAVRLVAQVHVAAVEILSGGSGWSQGEADRAAPAQVRRTSALITAVP